jgi:nucleotide-binding universal stress UspA family protein
VKPVIRRILVATDFSPASESAIDYAALLALALWPSVHVLHVLEEPFLTHGPGEFYSPDVPTLREQLRLEAESRLSPVKARFTDGCSKVTTEVRFGTPTEKIIAAALDYADLIIMGTHGRTGLSHLVHGSVAERVIRGARCPVLAVRAAGTNLQRACVPGTASLVRTA